MRLNKLWVALSIVAALTLYSKTAFTTVTNQVVSTTTAMGTGSATDYVIGFDFRDNSQVVVTRVDTFYVPATQTVVAQGSGSSKFTITGGNPGTTVHMGTAPTTTQYLIITRSIPLTQPVVFSPSSPFPYTDMGTQMDNVTLELQNLNSAILNAGISTDGAGAVSSALPTGVANNLLGWESTGASVVNIPNAALTANTFPMWNGSAWTQQSFTGAGLASSINSAGAIINPASGGTGVANNGLLTWGTHALTLGLSADTSVTLPTSGTLLAGTANSGNVVNTFVKRDGVGDFSASTITAATAFSGNLVGNVTGNVTGNTSGTSNNVTGTVAIGHGGTGQTSRQAAINALTGTQSAGKFLRSDGTDATLQVLQIGDVPQGFSRQKLAQDTINTIVTNDSSGNLSVLAAGPTGYVVTSNGVSWASAPFGSGIPGIFPYGADTGIANAYVVATPNPPILSYTAGIGVSFLAQNANTGAATVNVQGLGLQAIVEPGGGALSRGDILAGQMVNIQYDGTNFQLISPQGPAVSANSANSVVKRDSSGNFSAGTITGSLTGAASLNPLKSNNLSDMASVQTSLNNLAASVTSGQYLRGNGTNVAMSAISAADVPTLNQNTTGTAANITGIALVDNGGTGLSTLTSNNLMVGNGTGNVTFIAPGTNGSVLTSNGTSWTSAAAAVSGITQLTSDVTAGPGSGSQAATIAGHAVTNAKAAQMAAHTFKGNNTASTADALDLTRAQLTADLNQFTSTLQGVVPLSGGGTTNFLRADGAWAVAGSGSVTSVAATVPSFLSISGSPVTGSGTLAFSLSGTALPVTSGGTGLSTITAHNVLLGEGTSAVTPVAPGASGIPLISQGASSDPAFGIATVPGGGTGLSTLTANQIILGGTTTTGALQQVAGATSGYVLTAQGTTSAPTFVAPTTVGAVAAMYALTSAQSPGSNTQINFDTKVIDTNNAVTTGVGSWKFTAPYSGNYLVQMAGQTASGTPDLFVYVNGTSTAKLFTMTTGSFASSGSVVVSALVGQTIDVRPNTGVTLAGTSIPYETYVSIALQTSSPAPGAVSWSGYSNNSQFWSTTSGTFADYAINAGTATLTQRTNQNFPTVTTAASNLPGITFTPTYIQTLYVCANINNVQISAAGLAIASLEMVDGSGTVISTGNVLGTTSGYWPMTLCGLYNASTSATTIKLKGATTSGTTYLATQGLSQQIEWSVTALNAPNSNVASSTTGSEHIEEAQVTISNTSAAIVRQSGNWLSVANGASAGLTTGTITAGEFSAAPSCTCTVIAAAATTTQHCGFTAEPTTTQLLFTRIAAGAAANGDVNVICMGPR